MQLADGSLSTGTYRGDDGLRRTMLEAAESLMSMIWDRTQDYLEEV